MKYLIIIIFPFLFLISCCNDLSHDNQQYIDKYLNISPKMAFQQLTQPNSKQVMVAAHRGDWRNAPENSLQAIKNCIEMGVDIVEIDIRKTKDGKLVLMHDKTIDRTTTGKGKLKNWTYDSLKTLFLKNGLGRATDTKVPTLEEAMLVAKGKILVNLDKSYKIFKDIYPILKRTGTISQVILKGSKTVDQVKKDLGKWLKEIYYMPIVNLDKPNAKKIIEDFQKELKPVAFELVFDQDTSKVLSEIKKIKKNGSRVWVNSLWASLNAGHYDNLAITDPENSWGWILRKGANMIQTDRPEMLLKYLRKKGLR